MTFTVDNDKCDKRTRKGDTIKWHYIGTFTDGTEFHSGIFKAKLGHRQVITGVDRGMLNMCVGEKRRLTIHPDWAYGKKGRKDSIPPNATLIFDVELFEIDRPEDEKEEL